MLAAKTTQRKALIVVPSGGKPYPAIVNKASFQDDDNNVRLIHQAARANGAALLSWYLI